MRKYSVASCEEKLVKPDWVIPDESYLSDDEVSSESESASDGYLADDEDHYIEESPFVETHNPYIYKGKKGFALGRFVNPFLFWSPLKPFNFDLQKKYTTEEQKEWLKNLRWDELADLKIKGLEGIGEYQEHLNGLMIEGPAMGYDPHIVSSTSTSTRKTPARSSMDRPSIFYHCISGGYMSGINRSGLYNHWHLDAIDHHDPITFTIPMNKTEYLGLSYSLGIILPWTRPHCSGVQPKYVLEVHGYENPDEFDHYLPVDNDISFTLMTNAYRREKNLRLESFYRLQRLAETEGRFLPFLMGTQFSSLSTNETKFFIEMDRPRPCLIKFLAKGKEKKTKEAPKSFKWARHIPKRLPHIVYDRLKTIQEHSTTPIHPRMLQMIEEHEGTLQHCSGSVFDEDSATVGTILPGAATAYINYPDQPDLQIVPSNRFYSWNWEQSFSSVVRLPHLTLYLRGNPNIPLPVEEASQTVSAAEYNQLKRKYDSLENQVAELRAQVAFLMSRTKP